MKSLKQLEAELDDARAKLSVLYSNDKLCQRIVAAERASITAGVEYNGAVDTRRKAYMKAFEDAGITDVRSEFALIGADYQEGVGPATVANRMARRLGLSCAADVYSLLGQYYVNLFSDLCKEIINSILENSKSYQRALKAELQAKTAADEATREYRRLNYDTAQAESQVRWLTGQVGRKQTEQSEKCRRKTQVQLPVPEVTLKLARRLLTQVASGDVTLGKASIMLPEVV